MKSHSDATLAFKMSDTNLGTEMRKRRGTRSLRDIAKDCGIGFSTLARCESGKIEVPSRETLNAISYGYGMPLELLAQLVYLGGRTPEPEGSDDTGTLSIDRLPAEDRAAWSNTGRRLKHATALTS